MKRFITAILIMLCASTASAHSLMESIPAVVDKILPTAIEIEALDLINAERQKMGIHPLTFDNQLLQAARGHSEDMAAQNSFSHTSQDGRTYVNRIDASEYDYGNSGNISENIAAGQPTAQSVFESWMTSDGHRNNMLNKHFRDAGLGFADNQDTTGPEPEPSPESDLEDSDGDGVLNQEEYGPKGDDKSYDGNADGTADCTQANVVSGYNYAESHYLTLSVQLPANLADFEFADLASPNDAPLGVNFSLDCFSFRITGIKPGGAVSVALHLPENIQPISYHNYGVTPDAEEAHWYPFESDGTTGAQVDDKPPSLLFVDGQRGDDDLDATNGEITSMGGPATTLGPPADPITPDDPVTPDDTTPDDSTPDDSTPDDSSPDGSATPGDGGSSGCFVDTLK